MVTKRKPGRPRKNPESSPVAMPPISLRDADEVRTKYVYRPGPNGDHYIDAEYIAVHAVAPIAKAASKNDAECLVRILNKTQP